VDACPVRLAVHQAGLLQIIEVGYGFTDGHDEIAVVDRRIEQQIKYVDNTLWCSASVQ
jgi:hypothetical protein